MIKKNIIQIYLVYVNNFLSVEKFAECYGFSTDFANALIEEGRRLSQEY